MAQDISGISLADRLRRKSEENLQVLEKMLQKNYNNLNEQSKVSLQNALNTTESVINESLHQLQNSVTSRCQMLSLLFGKQCLRILLLTLLMFCTVVMGNWGLLSLFGSRAATLYEQIEQLQREHDTLTAQVTILRRDYQGLEPFLDTDGKRYLLVPAGRTLDYRGTVGDKQAWMVVRQR